MRLKQRHLAWAVLAAALPFSGTFASAADDRPAFTKLIATSRIYGFLEIFRNSGLPETMLTRDEVTLIVPVDTAFYTLAPEDYRALLAPENRELAARYIRAHVVPGRLTIDQLAAAPVTTLGGIELEVERLAARELPRINGCTVTLPDQGGTPGMFHLIDGFLFQP